MRQDAEFFLAQYDTSPSIQATLLGTDGATPQNLTGASVRFEIGPANESEAATVATAVIVGDPTLGVVRYDWQAADVETPGTFNAEWVVTLPGGREMTWPNDRYIRIEIKPRIDPANTTPVPPPAVGLIAVIVSLDGINTGAAQLVSLPTSGLASGSLAWCEAEKQYFILDQAGAETVDGVTVIAGLGGGQWSLWQGGGSVVEPLEATLVNAVSMAASITSVGINVASYKLIGLAFNWTGSAVGPLSVLYSQDSTNGTDGTWTDMGLTGQGNPQGVDGKSGASFVFPWKWLQVHWERQSGTGALTVRAEAKP